MSKTHGEMLEAIIRRQHMYTPRDQRQKRKLAKITNNFPKRRKK